MLQQLQLPTGPATGVVADHVRGYLVAAEESPGQSSVLGSDQRHGPQDLHGPVCEVAEIADRSGDDEEPAAGARRRAPLSRRRLPRDAHGRAEPGRRRG